MMWPANGPVPGLLLLLSPLLAVAVPSSQFERLRLAARPCPEACAAHEDPADWNYLHSTESLATCPEPILLDYNLYTPFGDDNTDITIRACTLGNAASKSNYLLDSGYVAPDALEETNFGPSLRRRANVTCDGSGGALEQSNATARISMWDQEREPLSDAPGQDVQLAIKSLQEHMSQLTTSCQKKILFSYVRGTLVGLYSGSRVDENKSSTALLQLLKDHLGQDGKASSQAAKRHALEICGKGSTAGSIFGVVADASGDFAAVQKVMKRWNDGKCAAELAPKPATTTTKDAVLWSFALPPVVEERDVHVGRIVARADCRSISAEGGDTCDTLAARCGVGSAPFRRFNKFTNDDCSAIVEGQPVCCSTGTLPNVKPGPGSDGICASYVVGAGEGCQVVAVKHGIKVEDIEDFNKKTWGWSGCDNLQNSQKICVSSGKPPMPATVKDAVCGPTVPGTKAPADGKDLADLNPCPLDVCCNIWGNCGTTEDFCVVSKSETGAPGTSKPGANGCVSNCGMKLVNNDVAPSQFRKIGYFEAWNQDRPCLNMHVLDIPKGYTHVHFAFGEISPDFKVVIPDNQREQWDAFLDASDFPKKILAFGGWAFSNEGGTSGLFRKAYLPGNRQTFADNVAKFAVDNGLDGVDFDWEYPGAEDIEGSEPGQEEDGENYYQFLKLLREKLPKNKSLSIAAPASYWYLRGFPIKKMAPVLDYIVYMTYDLHGQWDVGSKWASPGCPAGNCLRSHVNSTETYSALVMITKAGVPSHKVVVGVSSYGRSFKMSDSNCRGPQCTFLGKRNESPAKKGRCTDTGGYISDFEINEIIQKGGAIKSWYDKETDSDYLVYEGTEWVAYMSKITKSRRMKDYKNLNFGGTSDWAIDLQEEGSGSHNGTGRPVYLSPDVYKPEKGGAKCQPPCILVFPPSALPTPTTIRPGTYVSSLEYGATGKTTISGKETTAFVTKTTTITVTIPPITISSMTYSNVNITVGQKTTALRITPSIKIGPVSIRVPDGEGGTTTRTLTLPPWPAITKKGGSDGGGGDDDDDDDDNQVTTKPSPTTKDSLPPPNTDNPKPPVTTKDLPTYTRWPSYRITPVPEKIEEIGEDDDGSLLTPCNLWFFNLCPDGKTSKIGGLKWRVPPGIYPPGPPGPDVIGPPGPKPPIIKPPPPPWPPITIGRDNKPTYTKKPTCETESASFCSTTTTISTITQGPTTTKVTSTKSGCDTVYGCSLTDWETQVTTRTAVCALPTRRAVPGAKMETRDEGDCTVADILIIPNTIDSPNSEQSRQIMSNLLDVFGVAEGKVKRIESKTRGLVFAYFVPHFVVKDGEHAKLIDFFRADIFTLGVIPYTPDTTYQGSGDNADVEVDKIIAFDGDIKPNNAMTRRNSGGIFNNTTRTLFHRQSDTYFEDESYWALSQVCLPPGSTWVDEPPYKSYVDTRKTLDQNIYIIGEAIDPLDWRIKNFAFTRQEQRLRMVASGWEYPSLTPGADSSRQHGLSVSAAAIGLRMGTCMYCHLTFVQNDYGKYAGYHPAMVLKHFAWVMDDIGANRGTQSVINMSWHLNPGPAVPKAMVIRMGEMLELLESSGVVLVTAAGNTLGEEKRMASGEDDWSWMEPDDDWGDDPIYFGPTDVNGFPALFGNPNFPLRGQYDREDRKKPNNIIVVGATDKDGKIASVSRYNDFVVTWAPGEDVDSPKAGTLDRLIMLSGTSIASPMVAGLVGYLRSLGSQDQGKLQSPSYVKEVIVDTQRPIHNPEREGDQRMIWNGQVKELSCFGEDRIDPECRDALSKIPPASPGGGNEGGKSIDWTEGPSSPKCPSGTCGGELCRGYYCVPRPKGPPPDFRDPKDPKRGDPNVGGSNPGDPNVGGGDNAPGNGDDEEEEPKEPSKYDWGIRLYMDPSGADTRGCENQIGPSYTGYGESDCIGVDKSQFKQARYKAAGFTKNKMKACFYTNNDCAVKATSDYALFAGGDRFWNDATMCVAPGGGMEIASYRVTKGECANDEGYYGITWWDTGRVCEGSKLGRNIGQGTTKCNTEVPKGAKAVSGYTAGGGDLMVCLYPNAECDGSGDSWSVLFGEPDGSDVCDLRTSGEARSWMVKKAGQGLRC